MRLAIVLLTCAAAASAQPRIANANLQTRAISGSPQSEFAKAQSATWFGYSVPVVAGERNSCCYYSDNGRSWTGCALEEGRREMPPAGQPSGPIRLEAAKEFNVLYRVENGQVQKIRSFTGECDLDAGGLPVIWLTGVTAAASLAHLDTYVGHEKLSKHAVSAISLHSDTQAAAYLEKYMDTSRPETLRRHVASMAGAMRPDFAKKIVADTKQPDKVRESAMFGLPAEDLIPIAKNDASSHLRGQALFWLAQKAAKQAGPTIRGALDNDPDLKVKDKAVFALSQLREEGVPLLIDVARNNRSPEIRKKAIFWLGQSKDPRALKFFEELLNR